MHFNLHLVDEFVDWIMRAPLKIVRCCFLCAMVLNPSAPAPHPTLPSFALADPVPVCLQLEGFCETITDCMAEQSERLRYYEELMKG